MPEVHLYIERAVARVFVVSAEPIRVHSTCMKVPSAPHVVVRTASLALPLQSVKFVYSSLTVYALPALYFVIFRVPCGNQPHTSCSAAASAALHDDLTLNLPACFNPHDHPRFTVLLTSSMP